MALFLVASSSWAAKSERLKINRTAVSLARGIGENDRLGPGFACFSYDPQLAWWMRIGN